MKRLATGLRQGLDPHCPRSLMLIGCNQEVPTYLVLFIIFTAVEAQTVVSLRLSFQSSINQTSIVHEIPKKRERDNLKEQTVPKWSNFKQPLGRLTYNKIYSLVEIFCFRKKFSMLGAHIIPTHNTNIIHKSIYNIIFTKVPGHIIFTILPTTHLCHTSNTIYCMLTIIGILKSYLQLYLIGSVAKWVSWWCRAEIKMKMTLVNKLGRNMKLWSLGSEARLLPLVRQEQV